MLYNNAQLTFPIRHIYYLLVQEPLEHIAYIARFVIIYSRYNTKLYISICYFGFRGIILWRANYFGLKPSSSYLNSFPNNVIWKYPECVWQLEYQPNNNRSNNNLSANLIAQWKAIDFHMKKCTILYNNLARKGVLIHDNWLVVSNKRPIKAI